MDIEEQLDRAEKLPYPLLVGSSVKSADDSPHNNYIHPEKYTGNCKQVQKKKSILNASIGASLDDLISEGALLGSEEDFDRFLDDKGNILSDAKYSTKDSSDENPKAVGLSKATIGAEVVSSTDFPLQEMALVTLEASESPAFSEGANSEQPPGGEHLIYGTENFSTPNLSEYQIDHQISDHSELLNSVQSYDLSKLPSSLDLELKSKSNDVFGIADRVPQSIRPSAAKGNHTFTAQHLDYGHNAKVAETDSLHTPFFQRDDRSPSGSSCPVAGTDRSRSRSMDRYNPRSHLARGDSYKITHDDLPSKYELPAEMELEDTRESRQTRPTLGESVAAAEEEMRRQESKSVTRDPSLVTSGDYTNFDVDGGEEFVCDKNLYSVRSQSSTNYLRSISGSRSRQTGKSRDGIAHYSSDKNEKNDSNPAELVNEGAYVSDDPYGQVDGLDDMMSKVLNTGAITTQGQSQKNLVDDVSAEKQEAETKEQLNEAIEEEETNEKPSQGVLEVESRAKENEDMKDADDKEQKEIAASHHQHQHHCLDISSFDTVKNKAAELVECLHDHREVGHKNDEAENSVQDNEEPSEVKRKDDPLSLKTKKEVQETKAIAKQTEAAADDEEEEDFDVSPEELKKYLESLPIYLFTSLAGGMQIMNRTNRLVTILQASSIKFEYRDLGTDEEAKKIWRRYALGKTLPGIVRDDEVIGNWEYIEEVNEEYRLRSVLYETL